MFLFLSFTIKIESVENKENSYVVIFNSRKAIEAIQENYTKYDEMITDLNYDPEEDLVKFNNEGKEGLDYVNKYF